MKDYTWLGLIQSRTGSRSSFRSNSREMGLRWGTCHRRAALCNHFPSGEPTAIFQILHCICCCLLSRKKISCADMQSHCISATRSVRLVADMQWDFPFFLFSIHLREVQWLPLNWICLWPEGFCCFSLRHFLRLFAHLEEIQEKEKATRSTQSCWGSSLCWFIFESHQK